MNLLDQLLFTAEERARNVRVAEHEMVALIRQAADRIAALRAALVDIKAALDADDGTLHEEVLSLVRETTERALDLP